MEKLGGDDLWNGENINSAQSNVRPKEYAAAEVGGWYEATPTQTMKDILFKETDKDGQTDYRLRMSLAWNYPGVTYYKKNFEDIFKEKLDSYWILKYQNWQPRTEEPWPPQSFINERVMRFADVILMLAEVELELGNLSESVDYIDQIRLRANLNSYDREMNKEQIKGELIHQRAIEFFIEGERFYDLRRWGLLEDALKRQDLTRYANFSSRFYYFPIPAKELQTNGLCTPSEGW